VSIDRLHLRGLGQSGASDGQVPLWNNTTKKWEPSTPLSSGLTVQDENGNVGTGVTQIDFQGAGVTATAGTGEVVVTIPGGGSSTTADIPPGTPNSCDDEFTDASGQSGPTNGLAGKWSKHNLATSSWLTLDKDSKALGISIPSGQSQDQALYQAVPAGDFRLTAGITLLQATARLMFGIFIVNTSGTGISVEVDNSDSSGPPSAALREITSWAQTSNNTQINMFAGGMFAAGSKVYLSLRKASGVYYGAAWSDPNILAASANEVSRTPPSFTPAYIGIGQIYTSSNASQRTYLIDWVRVA
jgi:hypothetical protein